MQVSAKPIKDFFYNTGLLHMWAVKSAAGVAETVMQGGTDALQGYNALDSSTPEGIGYNAGAAISGVGDFAVNGIGTLAYFGIRNGGKATVFNGVKGVQMKDGFTRKAISKLPFMGGMRSVPGAPAGFIKNLGMLKGLGIMAAPIAAGMALAPALGFAGRILGENWAMQRRMGDIRYDNRYFSSEKYDMPTYQQLGQAYNNYESKMQSLARIYHSR